MRIRFALRFVMLFALVALLPILIGNWLLDDPIQRWEATLPDQGLVKMVVAASILSFVGLLALARLGDGEATAESTVEPPVEATEPLGDPRLTKAGREAWFESWGEFGYPIHWKGWVLLAPFLSSVGAMAWAKFPVERHLDPALAEKSLVVLVLVDVAWAYWIVARHIRPRRSRTAPP